MKCGSNMNKLQFRFTLMLAVLILYIYSRGYTVQLGDAFATEGHIEGSKHYDHMAADLNLFKDGVYLTETKDHEPFGKFWMLLGGTWGGRWDDGNHYSWGED